MEGGFENSDILLLVIHRDCNVKFVYMMPEMSLT